ncbi:4Fe-4S dicluster domain-containing protein [Pseudoclostridium thermosuccinogenes]|nr:4Fe-4S dicluster domain-containing protein [Pseudoclostridium thermosuccinogenes]
MQAAEREIAENIIRISGVNPRKCMKCGKCSGTCPAFNDMDIHPHQFVSMVEKGKIKELMKSKSIWTCLSCFACVERCPRNVEPVKLIEAARLSVIRRQGENHLKADEIPALLDENIPQQAIVSAFRKYSK